jgi:hypothetical protein
MTFTRWARRADHINWRPQITASKNVTVANASFAAGQLTRLLPSTEPTRAHLATPPNLGDLGDMPFGNIAAPLKIFFWSGNFEYLI